MFYFNFNDGLVVLPALQILVDISTRAVIALCIEFSRSLKSFLSDNAFYEISPIR